MPFAGPDFAACDLVGNLPETNHQREHRPDNELPGSTRSKAIRTSLTRVTLPIGIQCRQHPACFQPGSGRASERRARSHLRISLLFAVFFTETVVPGQKRKAVSLTGKTHGLQCSIAGKSQSDYFPAGFFAAGALVALAAPVFALVDLAAPDFALVDFGAAGFAAVLVLVVFAAGAFAAVLFAAIPIFLRGEFIDTDLNCRMPAGVGRWQPRDTNGCGEANKTHQIQPSGL